MAKKALIVGINQFRGSDVTTLRGCVNDALHWADLLTEGYGFAESNVEVLRDSQATKRVLLRALDGLLQNASPGDTVAFIISTHGTQVPDEDGDEIDDMDEVLVTHDFSWDNCLTDDEFSEHLITVPKGVQLVTIFDTCHSGTMMDTKALASRNVRSHDLPPESAARYIATPVDLIQKHRVVYPTRPRAYSGFGPQKPPQPRQNNRPLGFNNLVPGLSLSAADDDETAADAEFGGTPFGAFSFNMMAALREGPAEITWDQAQKEVLQRLRSRGFRQTPRLQLPQEMRNQPVFGGRTGRAIIQAAPGFGLEATGNRAAPLAILNQIDTALAQFKPDDYSVRLCKALFGFIPFAGPMLPYQTVNEAIQSLYPQASPQVIERALQIARGDDIKGALRAIDLIDKADAGLAMYSGAKGAYNLLFGDRSVILDTDTQQGLDAMLKLLGIGYIIAKMYPGTIGERVQMFYTTPSGKHIIVYYSLIDVALPFLDNALTASGSFVNSLMLKYGGEASGKLTTIVGGQGASEAQGVIQTMMGWIEGALTSMLPYARSAAEKIREYVPGALSAMDKAASVVATGADALPVYRYLGSRLAAETAVLLASREG